MFLKMAAVFRETCIWLKLVDDENFFTCVRNHSVTLIPIRSRFPLALDALFASRTETDCFRYSKKPAQRAFPSDRPRVNLREMIRKPPEFCFGTRSHAEKYVDVGAPD